MPPVGVKNTGDKDRLRYFVLSTPGSVW